MSKEKKFNYENFESGFASQFKKSGALLGKEGALTPLVKHLLEAALDGELDAHLEADPKPNRRNGKSRKQVKLPFGESEILTPRDRNSTFEPELLPKRQTSLGVDIEQIVLAMYGQGSSYQDICAHLEELYGYSISPSTLTRVTDRIWPLVQQWRNRGLEDVYAFIWLDAMHLKIRSAGRVRRRAVYSVLGINLEGGRELLGIYVGENEGAHFWLQVLTDLKERGVEDVLIASIDNLKGFAEAIETVFPKTIVQLCVVHQVRNSLKMVWYKEKKEFVRDMKKIYKSATIQGAEQAMEDFEERWGKRYPMVIKSWRNNWDRLTSYYEFSSPIRKMVYTTNLIENFHRQLRRVTKTKGAFTSEEAIYKLLYLAQERIVEKWVKPLWGWRAVFRELYLIFGERMQHR